MMKSIDAVLNGKTNADRDPKTKIMMESFSATGTVLEYDSQKISSFPSNISTYAMLFTSAVCTITKKNTIIAPHRVKDIVPLHTKYTKLQ